ncbi:hypothetical protein FACS189481_4400 [Clostridia bacterium]|nr:hypothetical protein FACS189481_4400 [Clostridia bacterium]
MSSFNGQKERDLTPIKGKAFVYDYSYDFTTWDGITDSYLIVRNYDKTKKEYAHNEINLRTNEWLPKEGMGDESKEYTTLKIPGDNDNQLKITCEFNNGENAEIYRQNWETKKETLIFKVAKNRQFIPQFVSADGSILYGLSNHTTKTLCPVALNLKSGQLKVLYKDNDYDVLYNEPGEEKPLCDFGTSKPLMVQYYAKKFKSAGINSKVKKALKEVKAKLGCEEVRVLDISPDLNEYTLQREQADFGGNKYTYNLRTKKLVCIETHEIDYASGDLRVYARPISYLSRDGLKIEGYLTLPDTGKPLENLPTVVYVHGGPWNRDFWNPDSDVGFLASRGYAVLQINFRGSAGYGREFLEKGDKQWGAKMQDDITDGTNWLINKGIADKDRIAIYGWSYGGYAAFCGLTFTPKLYACGISCCGISDLVSDLENMRNRNNALTKQYFHHVGDLGADVKKLKKTSPAYHLDKIERPLFVVQGAADSNVNRKQSDKVVNALRKRGAKVEYMVREGEGHGFRKPQNLRDFYMRLEEFLAKHLKPSK